MAKNNKSNFDILLWVTKKASSNLLDIRDNIGINNINNNVNSENTYAKAGFDINNIININTNINIDINADTGNINAINRKINNNKNNKNIKTYINK